MQQKAYLLLFSLGKFQGSKTEIGTLSNFNSFVETDAILVQNLACFYLLMFGAPNDEMCWIIYLYRFNFRYNFCNKRFITLVCNNSHIFTSMEIRWAYYFYWAPFDTVSAIGPKTI